MTKPKRNGDRVEYQDDKWEWRDGRFLERNGSLVYVEDEQTGERDWLDYRRVK
jgi:hypothetical protein